MRNVGLRIVLVATAMVLAAGCREQPQKTQQTSQSIAKEPRDMRTVIPLIRRLDSLEAGPVELEFDVPAQSDDATPPVFIGVRVAGVDPTAVANTAGELRREDISAQLHLFPIDRPGTSEVALKRSRWISRSESESVALTADGMSPQLFAIDADFGSMQAAGLLSEGNTYQELAFAYTPELPAGRYRLTLRFAQHREVLVAAKAELLVAYTAKGK